MSRVAVVTGAGGGIGRSIAEAFAAGGDTVVLAARRVPELEETARMVEEQGGRALVVPTDVTDPESVTELAARVEDELGRIDVVVNNSGVGGPTAPLWEVEPDDWDATFAVNVRGVYLVSGAFLPAMIEAGSGSVIVIGSISGKRPLGGRSAYTTSKMALVGLVRTLALEAGPHGIRVNLISPGFVEGPRIDWVIAHQAQARAMSEEDVRREMESLSPLGRLTRAADVASASVYLASEQARGITGADLNVNSGVVMY
ncbi:MAG: SDR family NAD(P)-dependent oxidoreductase [Actinomycetota bacterium]